LLPVCGKAVRMCASNSLCCLALAALVVGPFIGGGSRADAGFQAPGLQGRPQVALEVPTNVWAADGEAGMAQPAEDADFVSPRDAPKREPLPSEGSPNDALKLRFPGSGPASAPTGRDAPGGASGANGAFGMASSAPATFQPANVVQWLGTEEVRYRPPPMAWRLFRPPRFG
jgi:hypothetical protein